MIGRNIKLMLSLLILPILLISCSASKENNNEDQNGISNDSVYVFDQPLTPPPTAPDTVSMQPKEEPPPTQPPPKEVRYFYIVQIGAFRSNERAKAFADSAKKEINNKIEISLSSRVNLYVVHLMPPYATKKEAQKAREELWKKNKFKDAWILTVRQ